MVVRQGYNSQIAMAAGHVCQVVVMRGRLYSIVNEKTVVKSGWSLIRVVVHEEFYCTAKQCQPIMAIYFGS